LAVDAGTSPTTPSYTLVDIIAGIIIILLIIETAISFVTPYYDTLQLVTIPLSIFTLILFLIWFYRAYRNLPALGATELRFTPRWAVIWWFIPIFNFWKPYQVTVEIMKSSDSTVGRTDSATRKLMDRPNLVLIWWIYSFVAVAISFGALYWLGLGRLSNASIVESSFVDLPSLVVSVSGAIGTGLVILVIREITKRQTHKIELMRSGHFGIS